MTTKTQGYAAFIYIWWSYSFAVI